MQAATITSARSSTARSAGLPALLLAGLLGGSLAACGGGAALQTVKLTNSSPRPIEQLYVYPLGAPDHGASRGTLAPAASTTVQIKSGNITVEAVSALIIVDAHTRDRRTASTAVELKGPTEVIFFDADAKPAIPSGAIGVPFEARSAPNNPAPTPTAPPEPAAAD